MINLLYTWRCGILLLLVVVSPGGPARSQDEPTGIMPCTPEMLFPVLPGKVEGWKLTRSRGWSGLGNWLECNVRRDFLKIPDGKSNPGDPQPEVRLTVKDTGKYTGGDLRLFASFEPKANGEDGYEKTFVDGHPAIISRYGESTMAQLLVGNRYIVTILMKNLPDQALKKWYQRLKLGKLRSIKTGPAIKLPNTFQEITVDELDPTRNTRCVAIRGLSEIPADGTGE